MVIITTLLAGSVPLLQVTFIVVGRIPIRDTHCERSGNNHRIIPCDPYQHLIIWGRPWSSAVDTSNIGFGQNTLFFPDYTTLFGVVHGQLLHIYYTSNIYGVLGQNTYLVQIHR